MTCFAKVSKIDFIPKTTKQKRPCDQLPFRGRGTTNALPDHLRKGACNYNDIVFLFLELLRHHRLSVHHAQEISAGCQGRHIHIEVECFSRDGAALQQATGVVE
jgi:hypothetical protein